MEQGRKSGTENWVLSSGNMTQFQEEK